MRDAPHTSVSTSRVTQCTLLTDPSQCKPPRNASHNAASLRHTTRPRYVTRRGLATSHDAPSLRHTTHPRYVTQRTLVTSHGARLDEESASLLDARGAHLVPEAAQRVAVTVKQRRIVLLRPRRAAVCNGSESRDCDARAARQQECLLALGRPHLCRSTSFISCSPSTRMLAGDVSSALILAGAAASRVMHNPATRMFARDVSHS